MNLSVRSVLGWKISFKNKNAGNVSAVLFFTETGKLSCIQCCLRSFYSADKIFFGQKEIQLNASESGKRQGENWIGFQAVNATGKKIGTLFDVEFSPEMCVITRVVVAQKFLFIPISRHYFPFERIIDVRKKTVVLNTDTAHPIEEIIMHPARPIGMT